MGCLLFLQWWLWSCVFDIGMQYIESNVCTQVRNCFNAHKRVIWCLFPELQSNKRNEYQNNTRVITEKGCHESTYIIVFLTWHTESINDDKNDDFYTSSPCLIRSGLVLLMTSQLIADYITMTRQLWRGHVNNI